MDDIIFFEKPKVFRDVNCTMIRLVLITDLLEEAHFRKSSINNAGLKEQVLQL